MISIDSDEHYSKREFMNPFESNTNNLFRPSGELIGTMDDVDSLALRGQTATQSLLASDCQRWRLKDSFPMRIISVKEETVLIEILKDFESKATEERIFPISLFEGYETTAGVYFKIQILESKNSLMFQISQGSTDLEEHFPYFDFGQISQRSVFG